MSSKPLNVPAVERWRPLVASVLQQIGPGLSVVPSIDLVLAVIGQESIGAPEATRVEPDGRTSRGLMQVLDGTARELGVMDPSTLYVPAIGVAAGVRYLAKQLKRYRGSIPKAVAAYNAGTAFYVDNAARSFRNQTYVDRVHAWLAAIQNARGGPSIAPWLGAAATLAALYAARRLMRGEA